MGSNIVKKITTPKSKKLSSRSVTTNEIANFGVLGEEIKISPKSKVNINKPGYKVEYFTPTVEVLIGIGKDNTATLIMDEDAWKALKAGEPIDITTLKEFKKKFL